MISEWPLTPENATAVESQPSAPIEHETAVQSVDLAHAEPAPAQGFENPPQSFAPGDGQLEEELIDDEEPGLPAIHAGASEDYEEETLENAADLGTMLRERMSIGRTRSRGSSELDEDEDEDFDVPEEEMEEDEP